MKMSLTGAAGGAAERGSVGEATTVPVMINKLDNSNRLQAMRFIENLSLPLRLRTWISSVVNFTFLSTRFDPYPQRGPDGCAIELRLQPPLTTRTGQ